VDLFEKYLFQMQQNTWPVKNVTKLQVSTAEHVVLGLMTLKFKQILFNSGTI
jgi:hypothetical protein